MSSSPTIICSRMPKTAVSPNFEVRQLGQQNQNDNYQGYKKKILKGTALSI